MNLTDNHQSVGGRAAEDPISDSEYRMLAELRAQTRRYLAWAEQRAGEEGLTPAQVLLSLAVRASSSANGPTLKELASTLQLRHHSVVGLVDRTVRAGMVRRERDPENSSLVHVVLTDSGSARLASLTRQHLEWLKEHGGEVASAWQAAADME